MADSSRPFGAHSGSLFVMAALMLAPLLLLRVAATWPLPGLGLLALPGAPTPALAAYALHTALRVEAILPGGARHGAHATVEEITRPEQSTIPTRGLLLEFAAPVVLPPGTTIWLASSGPGAELA